MPPRHDRIQVRYSSFALRAAAESYPSFGRSLCAFLRSEGVTRRRGQSAYSKTDIPVLPFATLGYLALIALAAVLRWRYRTWLLLLLGALGAVAFAWQRVRFAREQLPVYRKEVAATLKARPCPSDPAELARLIASFKAIGDVDDANLLSQVYRLEVAHQLAGEPEVHFGTVAEAIAVKPRNGASGTSMNAWLETEKAERSALNAMLEVQAPRVSGWPPELARDAPPGAGAREIATGVWIWPKEAGSPVGILRFPLSVHNRGTVPIAEARLTVMVHDPRPEVVAGSRPSGFSCRATLEDVAQGETRWMSCDLTVGIGSQRVIRRLLDQIERLRAGELTAQVHAGGDLDASVRSVPDAEPLIAGEVERLQELKEDDQRMEARRRTLGSPLQMGLILSSVFVAGVVIPGLFGRCLSVWATLALVFAGAAVAFALGIADALRTPGVGGWEVIIGVFTAVEFGVPFAGGLLFGNLVYWRQKAGDRIVRLEHK
jgi:hypothetical protein